MGKKKRNFLPLSEGFNGQELADRARNSSVHDRILASIAHGITRGVNSYQEALSRLNPEQRLAVETVEGPVLVLAGPGTGKTQILTTRIASILEKTQAQPHNILALTFTNAAAKNMQQRLVKLIGTPGYSVRCTTFHSFCADVIAQHPEAFPVGAGANEAVSEVDRLSIMEGILDEFDFVHIKNAKNPRMYVRDILQLISQYKREGHTPMSLRQLLAQEREVLESGELTKTQARSLQKTLDKNGEVIEAFVEYDKRLRERGVYDYDDMILWVRDAFRDQPDVLIEYQELYQYVLVDEFQDTNQAQLQVVQSIVSYWGQQANFFAVGDPNQSIYRFQGASLANTLSFLELYPQATVITLREGYRCGQLHYDAAAQVIANNNLQLADARLEGLSEALHAASGKTGTIQTHEAPDTLAECFWILEQIESLQSQGVSLDEIAILYRKHSHSSLVQSVLERAGVSVIREGSVNILHEKVVENILVLLKFFVSLPSGSESTLMLPLLRLPWWNLNPTDVLKVIRAGAKSRGHQRSPWEVLQDRSFLRQLGLKDPAALERIVETVSDLSAQEQELPLPRFIESVLRDTGFYQTLQEKGQLAQLNAVASFLREVQRWAHEHPQGTLADFLTMLDVLEAHDVSISAAEFRLNLSAVRLLSAHQAKGQEWEHVFVLHTNDGFWGNLRSPSGIAPLANTIPYALLDKKERNEDERRLFFVALTRAKNTVHISWSQGSVEGDRRRELQPSLFLEELRGQPFTPAQELGAEKLTTFLRSHVEARASWEQALGLDRAWIASLVSEFSLSASALNDFLACPVGFLYKDLIRIPVQTTAAAAIGTAAHSALEFVGKEMMAHGEAPDAEKVLAVAQKSIENSQLPHHQVASTAAHISSVLARFYKHHVQELQTPLMVERFFGGGTPVVFEGLRLVGKVDRIELLDFPAVKVIDFKTSSPKSRNDILGKTKSSSGDYWRQLLFYRVLGDLDPTFPHKVEQGELVFLVPNDRDEFKSELFTYQEEDVEAFREILRGVHEQLQNLSFLEARPCGECETCRLLGLTASELEQQAAMHQLELFET